MITAIHILGLAFVYIAYKAYFALRCPPELKDVPAIPFAASMKSLLSGTSFDSHFEKLIHPALSKNDVARLWKQGHWELVVGNGQLVKEIFNNPTEFPKLNENDKRLGNTLGRRTLGYTSILLSDGDEWRRHRRIANPAFKKTWSTEMFGACADKLIKLIDSSEGAPVQIQDLFQRLTLDVLGNGLLSYDFEAIAKGNENYYLRLYHDVIGQVFNPIYMTFPSLENVVPWRQISHQKSKEFREFLRGIIRGRKAELYENLENHDDLLSLMTKASIDDKEANLSEDDVINDLSVFFLAGHDTTANTLCTIFYYLSKHPEIQEKARKEVQTVLKGEKRVPTTDELKEFHYIDCIIKESMRIISTVSVTRRYCKNGKTLSNGFVVPKDTYVLLHLWNVHHDDKVYPEPYAFNPDRFKESHGPEDSQLMAFGFGSRMCIGKNFSLMEQRVTIASLLQTYTCRLSPRDARSTSPAISNRGFLHPLDVGVIFEPIV